MWNKLLIGLVLGAAAGSVQAAGTVGQTAFGEKVIVLRQTYLEPYTQIGHPKVDHELKMGITSAASLMRNGQAIYTSSLDWVDAGPIFSSVFQVNGGSVHFDSLVASEANNQQQFVTPENFLRLFGSSSSNSNLGFSSVYNAGSKQFSVGRYYDSAKVPPTVVNGESYLDINCRISMNFDFNSIFACQMSQSTYKYKSEKDIQKDILTELSKVLDDSKSGTTNHPWKRYLKRFMAKNGINKVWYQWSGSIPVLVNPNRTTPLNLPADFANLDATGQPVAKGVRFLFTATMKMDLAAYKNNGPQTPLVVTYGDPVIMPDPAAGPLVEPKKLLIDYVGTGTYFMLPESIKPDGSGMVTVTPVDANWQPIPNSKAQTFSVGGGFERYPGTLNNCVLTPSLSNCKNWRPPMGIPDVQQMLRDNGASQALFRYYSMSAPAKLNLESGQYSDPLYSLNYTNRSYSYSICVDHSGSEVPADVRAEVLAGLRPQILDAAGWFYYCTDCGPVKTHAYSIDNSGSVTCDAKTLIESKLVMSDERVVAVPSNLNVPSETLPVSKGTIAFAKSQTGIELSEFDPSTVYLKNAQDFESFLQSDEIALSPGLVASVDPATKVIQKQPMTLSGKGPNYLALGGQMDIEMGLPATSLPNVVRGSVVTTTGYCSGTQTRECTVNRAELSRPGRGCYCDPSEHGNDYYCSCSVDLVPNAQKCWDGSYIAVPADGGCYSHFGLTAPACPTPPPAPKPPVPGPTPPPGLPVAGQ